MLQAAFSLLRCMIQAHKSQYSLYHTCIQARKATIRLSVAFHCREDATPGCHGGHLRGFCPRGSDAAERAGDNKQHA